MSRLTEHFAGKEIGAALSRLQERIGKFVPNGGPELSFAHYQLRDVYRLGVAAEKLWELGTANPTISAEAIDLLGRKILEHLILLEYLFEARGTNVVQQFLKTAREEFIRSYGRAPEGPGEFQGKKLPKYEAMARSNPALYEFYRILSYSAHPRGSHSYSLLEDQSGMTSADFFAERGKHAIEDVAILIHLVCDAQWLVEVLS